LDGGFAWISLKMRTERLRAPAALSARRDDAAVVLGREPVISDYQLIGLSRFLLTHATSGMAHVGCGPTILASLRRFCAIAASKNSSFAPRRAALSQAIEFEDALEMREQHLDLLPLTA
jgi:hypothetical protein